MSREFKRIQKATARQASAILFCGGVHNSEMYCETVHSVEKLADASFRLFVEKPWDEQTKVLARTTALSKKINETIERESPLVVALALLASIRVHEQLVNGTSN